MSGRAADARHSRTGGAPSRKLGAWDGAALVVSTVVGVGIFTTPGVVARMAPHPLAFLGVWLLGGLLSLAGALCYAELAALRPRAGGEYIYIREAFGPLAGFLSGWTSFVAGFSGAIAAGAVAFAVYLGRLVPALGGTDPLWVLRVGPRTVGVSPQELVAVILIIILSWVHLRGLGPGRIIQNVLAGLTVAAVVLLVVAGFAWGGAAPPSRPVESVAAGGSWLAALIPVMFTYSGWNAAAYIAGEVRDPGRNLPRALVLGTAAVVVLYLLLNLLYLRALPATTLWGDVAVGHAATRALFGPGGTVVFVPLILFALASGVSAMVVTGPRIYYAMARDGAMPAAFGRVSERGKVPVAAILAQGAWSCILVISGGFEALLTYTGFAIVLFAGIAVCALFVLRWRSPCEHRPYRAWGYPIVPGLFVLASFAMVMAAVRSDPLAAAAGALLIALGVPVRWCGVRLRERSRTPAGVIHGLRRHRSRTTGRPKVFGGDFTTSR